MSEVVRRKGESATREGGCATHEALAQAVPSRVVRSVPPPPQDAAAPPGRWRSPARIADPGACAPRVDRYIQRRRLRYHQVATVIAASSSHTTKTGCTRSQWNSGKIRSGPTFMP